MQNGDTLVNLLDAVGIITATALLCWGLWGIIVWRKTVAREREISLVQCAIIVGDAMLKANGKAVTIRWLCRQSWLSHLAVVKALDLLRSLEYVTEQVVEGNKGIYTIKRSLFEEWRAQFDTEGLDDDRRVGEAARRLIHDMKEQNANRPTGEKAP